MGRFGSESFDSVQRILWENLKVIDFFFSFHPFSIVY